MSTKVLSSIAILALTGLLSTSCWQATAHSEADEPELAHSSEEAGYEGHDHGEPAGLEEASAEEPGHGHGHLAEGSDLDRSVDELLADRCEHGMAAHECAECRYEVGMVLLDDRLFHPDEGVLRTVVASESARPSARDLNGEVRLNEERAVRLSPVSAGVVRAIHADVGQRVRRGQVLFEVESTELREAKASYSRTLAAETLATAAAERERDLHGRGISPRRDVEEAEAALAQAHADRRAAAGALLALGLREDEIQRTTSDPGQASSGLMPVRAPFDGVVLERSLSLGAIVSPGDQSLLLADISQVWVITTLYERELAAVLEAQLRQPVSAEVAVNSYPGRTFRGTIESIAGTIDTETRAARARVVVDNPEELLRAGMFARVRLLREGATGGVVVPSEAVLEDEGRDFVFVRLRGSLFVRRPVAVGKRADHWVEVVAGLEPGTELVTTGAFLLKSDVLRAKMGAGCAD